jgi:hypothetical protein
MDYSDKKNFGDPTLLKKGDLVTCAMDEADRHIVRTVTAIERSKRHGSGYAVSMDGGEKCPICHRGPARTLTRIDGTWAVHLKEDHDD